MLVSRRTLSLLLVSLLSTSYGKTDIFIDKLNPVLGEPLTGRIEIQNHLSKEIVIPAWTEGVTVLSAKAVRMDEAKQDSVRLAKSVCCSSKGPVKLAAGQTYAAFFQLDYLDGIWSGDSLAFPSRLNLSLVSNFYRFGAPDTFHFEIRLRPPSDRAYLTHLFRQIRTKGTVEELTSLLQASQAVSGKHPEGKFLFRHWSLKATSKTADHARYPYFQDPANLCDAYYAFDFCMQKAGLSNKSYSETCAEQAKVLGSYFRSALGPGQVTMIYDAKGKCIRSDYKTSEKNYVGIYPLLADVINRRFPGGLK